MIKIGSIFVGITINMNLEKFKQYWTCDYFTPISFYCQKLVFTAWLNKRYYITKNILPASLRGCILKILFQFFCFSFLLFKFILSAFCEFSASLRLCNMNDLAKSKMSIFSNPNFSCLSFIYIWYTDIYSNEN